MVLRYNSGTLGRVRFLGSRLRDGRDRSRVSQSPLDAAGLGLVEALGLDRVGLIGSRVYRVRWCYRAEAMESRVPKRRSAAALAADPCFSNRAQSNLPLELVFDLCLATIHRSAVLSQLLTLLVTPRPVKSR